MKFCSYETPDKRYLDTLSCNLQIFMLRKTGQLQFVKCLFLLEGKELVQFRINYAYLQIYVGEHPQNLYTD